MATALLVGFQETERKELELLSPGLSAELCESAASAIERLSKHSYDLLFYNLTKSSEELTNLLNQRPPALQVVTALTESFRDLAPQLVNLGVSRLFYHPLDLKTVTRQLAWILRLDTPTVRLFPAQDRRDPMKKIREDFMTGALKTYGA